MDIISYSKAQKAQKKAEDVQSQVANKADKSEVTGKADKSYVDNQLASKADTNYVDGQLANKADEAEVSGLQSQIDNLVVSGDSSVEAAQARVSITRDKTYDVLTDRIEELEKENYFPFKNIVKNGSFEDGKSEWTSSGNAGDNGDSSVTNERSLHGGHSLKIINDSGVRREIQPIDVVAGHKYYRSTSVYIESFETGNIYAFYRLGRETFDREIIGEWQTLTGIFEATATSTLQEFVGSNNTATYTAYFDNIIIIDLTEMYGAGKEPSLNEMDNIIGRLFDGYVEGDQSPNQGKMFNYLSNYIRPFSEVANGIMPIVSIVNDDGYATDYDLYKMLQKKGMRGTSFIVGSYIDGPDFLTEAQLKEMADAGYEIACHTYNHRNLPDQATPEDIIFQLFENKKYLEGLTGKKVETFAHPYGAYNAETVNLVRSFYEGARSSDGGYNEFGDVANAYKMYTSFWLDYGSVTVQRVKDRIDELVTGRPVFMVFAGHQLSDGSGNPDDMSLDQMEEIADYLKMYQMQGKLEVVTFAEGVRRVKSFPDFSLL